MEVEVHWVLDQVGVEVNEQAHRTAKVAPEGIGTRRCMKQFTSLAHMNQTIMEKKCKHAKHYFKAKPEERPHMQHTRYDPDLNTYKLNEPAMRGRSQLSRIYYQFKSAYVVIGIYFERIGRTGSDSCWEYSSPA